MQSSFLLLKDFRSLPNGASQLPDLVEMSSPKQQTEHRDEGGVDPVIISDLINFLSGLWLNTSTAEAAISEIQARALPSLFGTPPTSPATFPVSPQSSFGSTSPPTRRIYPSIRTPAPSPPPPPRATHADDRQIVTSIRTARPACSAAHTGPAVVRCNPMPSAPSTPHSASSARTTAFGAHRTTVPPNAVRTSPVVVESSPTTHAPSNPQSASSASTTAVGVDRSMPSGYTRFEVVRGSIKSVPVVGHPMLRTFVLETARGKTRWQQRHEGVYFDVPSPDARSPYYLVTKGARIGVLCTWTKTAPYVIGVRGSCYTGVQSINEGIEHMMHAIEAGETALL